MTRNEDCYPLRRQCSSGPGPIVVAASLTPAPRAARIDVAELLRME
jgi:hypothetical protein